MINTLYLSGPISNPGNLKENLAAFNRAAEVLRDYGYVVLNPADNTIPNPDADAAERWQQYMRAGLAQLVQAEGVATLARWDRSRGASLEVFIANQIGLAVMSVHDWCNAKPRPF